MSLEKAKEIFGIIGENLSLDEIKEKFRSLAKVFHPDLGGSNSKMAELSEAYRTLKDTIREKVSNVSIIPFSGDGAISTNVNGVILPGISRVSTLIGEALGGIATKTVSATKDIIEIVKDKISEHAERVETYRFNKNDMYEILNALEETDDFRILKGINPSFLNDPYFMMMAIDIVPESIYYASDELKKNPDFVLDVYENNPELLYFVSNDLRKNRDFILRAVEIYPCGTLEFGDRSFRSDIEVMKKAIQIDGLAYKYASHEIKNNKEIILIAISQNSSIINMINPSAIMANDLYNDPTFVSAAIKENNKDIIEKSGKELWSNQEFVIGALSIDKGLITKVDKELFNNIDFAKKIMDIDTSFLEYIGNDLKNNEEFAMFCVEKDGLSLKYFSGDIKANKSIVERALSNNVDAFKFAAPGLALDDEFLRKIAQRLGIGENKSLYEEKKYLEAVIKENGIYAWQKAVEINNYAFDIDILVNLLRQSNSSEIEEIYNMVKHNGKCHCAACGAFFDGDRITVNGERQLENKECAQCGSTHLANNDRLSNIFDFEYNLAKKNYVPFFDHQVDYIIKRAEEMNELDYKIIDYFPEERRNNIEFMRELAFRFGIQVVNYYKGDDRNILARLCVKQYGVESLINLSPDYLENDGFIAMLIRDHGPVVLDYVNPEKVDINKIKDLLNKAEEIENLKNSLANKPSKDSGAPKLAA